MRILYILPSLANTAPIRIALNIAGFCEKNGHDVEIAYFDDIVELPTSCRIRHISMHQLLSFDDYDIIHSHMRRPDYYVAKNKKRINRAISISTIHCDIYYDLLYSYGKIIASIYTRKWINNLKKMDITVQVSSFLMKKYKGDFKNNYLISNGVEIVRQKPDNCLMDIIEAYHKRNKIVILSYSNIIRRKGLQQVLYAVAEDARLAYLCIGNGEYKKEMINLCNKLKIHDRVSFYGFVNYPYNLVPYVDIVIIPSYSESFCLALHETGMMGGTIVCSKISAFTDAFTEEEVTFFELDDTKSLLAAIYDGVKSGGDKRDKIMNKELSLYTNEKMVREYMNLYIKCGEKNEE